MNYKQPDELLYPADKYHSSDKPVYISSPETNNPIIEGHVNDEGDCTYIPVLEVINWVKQYRPDLLK